MIGVVAGPADSPVVGELFELFKTPWEFYRRDKSYDVLLVSGDADFAKLSAPLVIIYGGLKAHSNTALPGSRLSTSQGGRILSFLGAPLPVYGESVTFDTTGTNLLVEGESFRPAVCEARCDGSRIVRVGYDLFHEVRHLLTAGQPTTNAASPTLDLHIAFLRYLIVSAGIPLVEIPPIPQGYRFIACLTHDVDHPFIHLHKFDHTMFGFLYRAVIGSVVDLLRGRASPADLLRNWLAALKLPVVYLGLAEDFWSSFDRYTEIEGSRPSTFFIIPFRNTPGRTSDGVAPHLRSTPYAACDVANQIHRLLSANREIGLHGIDAWIDPVKGREELGAIRSISGGSELGVRMHWLYFDEETPVVLENAGASYDSTVGYNETVGFRAGTGQAYRPLNASTLLELPLHVMDTALFYPSHLHLSPDDAVRRIDRVIEDIARHGGCLTVNWHDRSIAPERLWTRTYESVLQQVNEQDAWFATAAQAVAWFRMRRSVTFESDSSGQVRVTSPAISDERLPRLVLRSWSTPGAPTDVVLPTAANILLPQVCELTEG
jgi:hypothetical protein